MVIEFGNGFHPLSHQIATGFGFPGHLPKQAAGKESGKTIAENEHIQAGQAFLKQKAVKNNTESAKPPQQPAMKAGRYGETTTIQPEVYLQSQ